MMNYSKRDYKRIILDTSDAVTNSNRTQFTFNNLKLIDIKQSCFLKVCSVVSNTSGDEVFIIKIHGLEHEHADYWNSDKSSTPTILTRCFNGKSSLNLDGYALTLPPQEVNNLSLYIQDTDGNGLASDQKIIITMSLLGIEETELS
jgi:hypothetical protein